MPPPHYGGQKGQPPRRANPQPKKEGAAPQPEGRGNHHHKKDGQEPTPTPRRANLPLQEGRAKSHLEKGRPTPTTRRTDQTQPQEERAPTLRRTPTPHSREPPKSKAPTREARGNPRRKYQGATPRRANLPPLEGVANLNKKKEGRIHTRRTQPQEGRAKHQPREGRVNSNTLERDHFPHLREGRAKTHKR